MALKNEEPVVLEGADVGDVSFASTDPHVFGRHMAHGRRDGVSPLRLVPNSTIQFHDFELETDQLSLVYGRFQEQIDSSGNAVLVPLDAQGVKDGVESQGTTRGPLPADDTHWNTGYGAIEPFLDQWVPLPYLRVTGMDAAGQPTFDSGPGNWVRLFIARPAEPLRQVDALKSVLAIDTFIAAHDRLDAVTYLAPNLDDLRHGSEFWLAASPEALSDLLAEPWLQRWLAETEAVWRARLAADTGGSAAAPMRANAQASLNHIAQYLSLLDVLTRRAYLPPIRFIAAGADDRRTRAVTEVDLVLDIDDEHTAAMLVERSTGTRAGRLPEGSGLVLRDLSRPTERYSGAFPTYGEFRPENFGSAAASRLSGRSDAFLWPSLMRVGVEAHRHSLAASAVRGVTGQGRLRSSLKHEAAQDTVWRFGRDDPTALEPGSMVAGPLLSHIDEDGNVVGDAAASRPGAQTLRPRFSHSSLLSLFVAELVLHALAQANSDRGRAGAGELLKLRRVMVTCPADADEEERRLLHRRVKAGVALVWRGFGWHEDDKEKGPAPPVIPDVVLGLDAGLSAQLLYVFDEVQDRSAGSAQRFISRIHGTPVYPGRGGTTVASLDLGSAATALIVTRYALDAQGDMHPQLVFADRSPVTNRGLIDRIIECIIRPCIEKTAAATGYPSPQGFISHLFGGNSGASSQAPRIATRLAHNVLEPAAQGLLALCGAQDGGLATVRGQRTASLATLVDLGGGRLDPLASQVDELAVQHSARGFALGSVEVVFSGRQIVQLTHTHFEELFDLVTDVVREHRCDLLLLSGANAHLTRAKAQLLQRLPIAPHRIVELESRHFDIVERVGDRLASGIDRCRQLALIGLALAGNDQLGRIAIGETLLERGSIASAREVGERSESAAGKFSRALDGARDTGSLIGSERQGSGP